MVETQLKEVERFKVGFASDLTGATHKYLILNEIKDSNKYTVRHFLSLFDVWKGRYLADTPIEIKSKNLITDIHYETLEGIEI